MGDRLTGPVRAVKIGTDETAERAELVEHGAAAHPRIETSTHAVARKRQHDSFATAFIDVPDNPDTRHEFAVDMDVEPSRAVPGRTSPTAPVTETQSSCKGQLRLKMPAYDGAAVSARSSFSV